MYVFEAATVLYLLALVKILVHEHCVCLWQCDACTGVWLLLRKLCETRAKLFCCHLVLTLPGTYLRYN